MSRTHATSTVSRDPVSLAERYRVVRTATERLADPLSPEDCTIQSMPDASPTKWHLAHTSWYFETFVLENAIAGYRPFDSRFRELFNSYYESVGPQHARPERGMLSRPGLDAILDYRRAIDHAVLTLLEKPPDLELAEVLELGIQHEQQHQELVLTDLKHMLSRNPLRPAYRDAAELPQHDAPPLRWHDHPEGLREVGHSGEGFGFDNEGPRHRVYLQHFELASRPVTNADYLEFMADGGYSNPLLWLADGWATRQERAWSAPLYWERRGGRDGDWETLTLSGPRAVRPGEPVCHVSYYEADAYARWFGARLPSEAEWEIAACAARIEGNFVESGSLHPRVCEPAGSGPQQLFGDVWEWTRSPYVAYPGFRAAQGALGEYNGKFMSNQLTLRGGSCATPQSHIRASYRNFFYPDARWQFSGLRLAR